MYGKNIDIQYLDDKRNIMKNDDYAAPWKAHLTWRSYNSKGEKQVVRLQTTEECQIW